MREYKKRASGAFGKVTTVPLALPLCPAAAMGKVLVITADRVT